MIVSAPTPTLAEMVAGAIDAATEGRVLVLGSLPPGGRDLDLLARSEDRQRIDTALVGAGLVRKGSSYALFGSCSAYGVDMAAAEPFLPAPAVDDLFAQALPLDGFQGLVRPTPGHALLVLARLVLDEGVLSPKRRKRLGRILAEDPGAWESARRAAPSWRAERALKCLERAAAGDGSLPLAQRLGPGRLKRALRPPHRGVFVALSGIDGAGKSSQARWLTDALTALDAEVEVVWNDMSGSRVLGLMTAPVKALLGLLGRRSEPMAHYDEAPLPSNRGAASGVRGAWALLVSLANALDQRRAAARGVARGRVVVFDRSPLDLAVRMQVLYRSSVQLQRRLVRIAAPRPDLAFLLNIPAEVSLRRKDDIWSPTQLGEQTILYRSLAPVFRVRVLDGCRPPDELAAEIAAAVWQRLR